VWSIYISRYIFIIVIVITSSVTMNADSYRPVIKIKNYLNNKPNPLIHNFLEYYFDNFDSLLRSGKYYSNFWITCGNIFMPDFIHLMHPKFSKERNEWICTDMGPGGVHQVYRDFLSHIIINIETYTDTQLNQIKYLLFNMLEENGIARICYIDFTANPTVWEIFAKFHIERDEDGTKMYCTGNTLRLGGFEISNSRVCELINKVLRINFLYTQSDIDQYIQDNYPGSEAR
jgi:hypothetical protein